MGKLTKEGDGSPWRRLSVPILNKINTEVFRSGSCYFLDNNLCFDHSFNSLERQNYAKERKERKNFLSRNLSVSGSSINEKAKSAPSTPLGLDKERRRLEPSFFHVHNVRFASTDFLNRTWSDDIKRLKADTSSMTQAYSVSRGPADPDGSAGAPLITKNFETAELIQSSRSSKARQKKFHRHFKQVDNEEKVLNYYSCALVGDILLQGHLYITENFFAFYSNVFGYVTKLLIPTVDVLKISKEKTAKIIPNAVGISTEDEKHVFGSLLSRDSTYKFMLQVWKAANSSNPVTSITPPPIKAEMPSDEDSSVSTGNEEPSFISNLTTGASSENFQKLPPGLKRRSILLAGMEMKNSKRSWTCFKSTTVLTISVGLLALLLVSAGYLLYRIAIIQNHFEDLSPSSRGNDMYEDILKWQSALHSTSANKMYEFLNMNLNQIVKVRLSLEALSMLILPKNIEGEKPNQHSKWGGPNVKESNGGPRPEESTRSQNQ